MSGSSSRVEHLQPIAALAQIRAYAPPRSPTPIDLDLSANEGPLPAPALLAGLLESDEAGELLRRYPDARALEAALATRYGLEPERVLVCAGADDALARALRVVAEPGREVILPEPTFEMLPRYVALAGAERISVAWPGGAFPRAAVLAAASQRTAAVLVVSPNNPTGAVATADDLRALCAALPRALVIVDQAYAEFCSAEIDDLTAAAATLENAIVTRTFSKAWGLAGLRVGYALGAARVLAWLRAVGQPYAVGGLALALAGRALDDETALGRTVTRVQAERQALAARLQRHGAHCEPSQANFAFARFEAAGRAPWLVDALAGQGIRVRRWPDRPGLEDAVRIGCPADATAFARLERALEVALAPQALLFDLDGVLADVSRSYREAIRQTCASYDVTVDDAAIAAAKARGDANDDWRLTQRLLAARGVERPLDEVTARFEALYQGDGERAGLWQREGLLVERAWLVQLATRWPLAIVTGRPRADAERFLQHFDLLDVFAAVIAREDAPALKPDPAPVRAALTALGVERAWMIGDTPDDLRAARAAEVLPLAITAPGEATPETTHALLAAGAGRVLSRLPELDALLRP